MTDAAPLVIFFLLVAGYFFFRWQVERSRVQAIIAESRNLLLTVIDTAPTRVFWKDRHCRYLGCNKAFASDAGMAHPRDLIGKDDYQMPWTAYAESYRADDLAVMSSGIGKLSYDEQQTTLGGQTIWLRTSKVPLKNRNNETIGLLGVYEDITERKQAEWALQQSERELREVQVLANIGNWQWDIKTDQHFWSEQIFQIYGRDPHTPAASYLEVQSYFTKESWAPLSSFVERCLIDGNPYECDAEVVRPDGVHRWIVVFGEALKDGDGKIVKLRGTVQDISDRKQAQDELNNLNRYFVAFLDNTTDFIYFKDENSRFRFCSQTLANITGHTSWRDMIGKHDLEVFPKETAQIYFEEELPVFKEGKALLNKIDPFFDQAGNKGWVSTSKWPMLDQERKVVGLFGISRDITQSKQMEEAVRQLAFHDALTNLPNRRLLTDRLSQAMAASKRNGKYTALMYLDLDNFKQLNDAQGHDAGDLMLMEVAARLKSCVREMDTVARVGGDEFVVLLSDLDVDRAMSNSLAAIVAEKIRQALSQPYMLIMNREGNVDRIIEHRCSASIGVVVSFDHETSHENILKWADAAMYQAKEDGRNLVRFSDSKV